MHPNVRSQDTARRRADAGRLFLQIKFIVHSGNTCSQRRKGRHEQKKMK